jgi:hypothetical protein
MKSEIGQLVADAKLLKNGKIIDNSKFTIAVDSTTSKRLSEDVRYTFDNFGYSCFEPYFEHSIKKWSASDIIARLGVKDTKNAAEFFYGSIDNSTQSYAVGGYKTFVELHKYNEGKSTLFTSKDMRISIQNQLVTVWKTGIKDPIVSISFADKFKMLHQTQGATRTFSLKDMTIEGELYKVVILDVDGNYIRNDSVEVNNINAYLFLK